MTVIRGLVLDNQAAWALGQTAEHHPVRAAIMRSIVAANGPKPVPTSVRVKVDVVEILTSDGGDMEATAGSIDATVVVTAI